MIIYVVQSGDTLSGIAREYGVSLENLRADNGLKIEDILVVGQALVIQIPEVLHTVRRGETLTSIRSR